MWGYRCEWQAHGSRRCEHESRRDYDITRDGGAVGATMLEGWTDPEELRMVHSVTLGGPLGMDCFDDLRR